MWCIHTIIILKKLSKNKKNKLKKKNNIKKIHKYIYTLFHLSKKKIIIDNQC